MKNYLGFGFDSSNFHCRYLVDRRGNMIWAQPYYLPVFLSATSLVVTTLVTPGWWYSDLLLRVSSESSRVILTPSWTGRT